MSTPPSETPAAFERRLMAGLARYIECHCDEPLPLRILARQAQLSPQHLQRRFKAVIGISPRAYHEACRLRRFKAALRAKTGEPGATSKTQGRPGKPASTKPASVTAALYQAGYGSSSRLYERGSERLGMTPRQYRAGAAALAISYAVSETPLGHLLLAATDRGLCFIQFGDSAAALLAELAREFPAATLSPMATAQAPLFDAWMRELARYLQGERPAPDLPLDIQGTAFQVRVWEYLRTIPPGCTASYGEVAAALGQPRAVRAVGSACARNRLAIAIPCHRVLRGSGDLAGYRWGLERKRALLELEAAANPPRRR